MAPQNLISHQDRVPTRHSGSDAWARLARYLLCADEAGIYRTSTVRLDPGDSAAVKECLREDGHRALQMILESAPADTLAARPTLVALALAACPRFAAEQVNLEALRALHRVVRTAPELRAFVGIAASLRGWGRALRTSVANWYLSRPVAELAFEMAADQESQEWSHRDLLRMSHPKGEGASRQALLRWAAYGELDATLAADSAYGDLRPLEAQTRLARADSADAVVRIIEKYDASHALVPSRWKSSATVWEALLPSLGIRDLAEQAPAMTAAGLLRPQSEAAALVVMRLTDPGRVHRCGIHPLELLRAACAYRRAIHAPAVADALEEAYALALANIKAGDKRLSIAIDQSPAMKLECPDTPGMTSARAAERLVQTLQRMDPDAKIGDYTGKPCDANIVIAAEAPGRTEDFGAGVSFAALSSCARTAPQAGIVTEGLDVHVPRLLQCF